MDTEKPSTAQITFDATARDGDDEMHDDIPMEKLDEFKKDIEFDKIITTEVIWLFESRRLTLVVFLCVDLV